MRMTQDARLLSYGVLLLLLIRFRPHGLWARCGPSTVSPSRYWKVDDHEDGPRPGKTETRSDPAGWAASFWKARRRISLATN
jgi:hypothetical protein